MTNELIDRLPTDWRDDHSLPVQLARAQIAALRTAGDLEGRYLAKWQLAHNSHEIGYNREQVREVFGLIDFRSTQGLEDWLDTRTASDKGPETTDQDS
jgi:hypothetical protein